MKTSEDEIPELTESEEEVNVEKKEQSETEDEEPDLEYMLRQVIQEAKDVRSKGMGRKRKGSKHKVVKFASEDQYHEACGEKCKCCG